MAGEAGVAGKAWAGDAPRAFEPVNTTRTLECGTTIDLCDLPLLQPWYTQSFKTMQTSAQRSFHFAMMDSSADGGAELRQLLGPLILQQYP